MNIETILAQAGLCSDKTTGAISTPIYQTATFRHPELGVSTGYDYSRSSNPTRLVLEETMARLERGDKGYAFSTGMAAITAILLLFKAGDHIIVSDDLYGGTWRIIEKVFSHFNLTASYVDTSNISAINTAIRKETRAVFIETPTNPTIKITDLKKAAELCKKNNLLSIVDNTFMTPYLQRPIELGIDMVVHSGTKYLGGHNDVLCGLIVTSRPELSEKIAFIQNSTGAVLSPFDSWLVIRGIKTLSLRLDRAQSNATKISEWLIGRKEISKVFFPELKSHPNRDIHYSQASGPGSVVSFRVANPSLVSRIINNVKIISFAESLGGVETLITFPVKQTHADIPEAMRNTIGITDDLLRLSVGIENIDDLIGDLEQAMEAK